MRERNRVVWMPQGESRTKQQFKKDCDINLIVAKYKRTGQIEHIKHAQAIYADVSNIGDYQECLSKVMAADSAFMALPSDVRARFGNDPGAAVAFVSDPANLEESVKLGLVDESKLKHPVGGKKQETSSSQPAAQGAGQSQGQAGGQA